MLFVANGFVEIFFVEDVSCNFVLTGSVEIEVKEKKTLIKLIKNFRNFLFHRLKTTQKYPKQIQFLKIFGNKDRKSYQ